MGTTLSSIHILSSTVIEIEKFRFASFSDGWQTCIYGFSAEDFKTSFGSARLISKSTPDPVLHFFICDSDYIQFEFLQNGKCIAKYSDDEFAQNKNLYGIPKILGYGDGYKKRLSSILGCGDAEEKTGMLEEYFGVCLLPFDECFSEPSVLKREKTDTLYKDFIKRESELSGKSAPISIQLIKEVKGKIFKDYFGRDHLTQKEHCYLFGYATEDQSELTPVRFTGDDLQQISLDEFMENRTPMVSEPSCFDFDKERMNAVIFNDKAPEQYRNLRMRMPSGMYPFAFDSEKRIVLAGDGKIAIADESLKIVAKCSIKGQAADMVGDYILTTSGMSFFGYVYDPISTVRIYKLVNNNEKLDHKT